MNTTLQFQQSGTALITGAAKRLGAATAKRLHQNGMNVIIHYNHSREAAEKLAAELNAIRPASATSLQANLNNGEEIQPLVQAALAFKQEISALINNASSFYPTPLEQATPDHWQDLFASNAQAPFFLSQALAPHLKQSRGCNINMTDIHAQRPLRHYNIYSMAKSSLVTLTKALAKELAPEIRVNGVAPGAILWPENVPEDEKDKVIAEIPLQRMGSPDNIADTISFLLSSDYITGQIIAVDGGRSL
jgi:pteridine reductase